MATRFPTAMLIGLMAWPLMAAPPETLRYQARLTDDAGIPLTSQADLTFAIFGVDSGGGALWSETIPGVDLGATNGRVDLILGKTAPIDPSIFGPAGRWLEITVTPMGQAPTVLTPRQEFVSVPYAHSASRLGEVVSTGGGQVVVSGGTGSIELVIEADTQDSDEDAHPILSFVQDGGATLGRLGMLDGNTLTLKSVTSNLALGAVDTTRVFIDDAGVELTGNVFVNGGQLTVGDLSEVGSANSLCSTGGATGRIGACSSSLAFKQDVQDLDLPAMDIVSSLRPRQFVWRASGTSDLGFVAEEVDRVAPILAFHGTEGEPTGVKYGQLTSVLVKALQEQERRIELLEDRLRMLEARLPEGARQGSMSADLETHREDRLP